MKKKELQILLLLSKRYLSFRWLFFNFDKFVDRSIRWILKIGVALAIGLKNAYSGWARFFFQFTDGKQHSLLLFWESPRDREYRNVEPYRLSYRFFPPKPSQFRCRLPLWKHHHWSDLAEELGQQLLFLFLLKVRIAVLKIFTCISARSGKFWTQR